jgi:creatinine amidohydrolase
MTEKYRYDELTWPEVKEAVAQNKVVLLPFGTIEDHGPHLPINTDNIIVEHICLEAARRSPADMLVMPNVPYGLDEHHMDFPGAISISMENCLAYVSDVAISVAQHGFTHILIVNGHGSNAPLADLIARKTVLATGAICAAVAGNAAVDDVLVRDVIAKYRRSAPGGVGHACEYETAMMLYLCPDLVQMDKAVKEVRQLKLKYFNWDYPEPSAYAWQDWWSRFSESGICGDPTVATAEFGKFIFETNVTRLIDLVREFRTIPIKPRVDHH